MNILTKLSLTALAVATLAGCASAPLEPPKTEAERVASGSLLHVPVAINLTDFTWHKVTVKATEKRGWFNEIGSGTVTIFTNKNTGKTYDFEGQPVTAEGYRVLTDGYVCVPKLIEKGTFGKGILYGEWSAFTSEDSKSDCLTIKYQERHVNKVNKPKYLAPAVLSGAASVVALGYLVTTDNDTAKQQQEIEEIIKDDINS